jgi:hypothetical protein
MESLRKAITRAATPASIIGTVVNEEGYRKCYTCGFRER